MLYEPIRLNIAWLGTYNGADCSGTAIMEQSIRCKDLDEINPNSCAPLAVSGFGEIFTRLRKEATPAPFLRVMHKVLK